MAPVGRDDGIAVLLLEKYIGKLSPAGQERLARLTERYGSLAVTAAAAELLANQESLILEALERQLAQR
ncbi:MAG: hypothetical protein IRY95_08370 [Clostridia bacterium]|nr:hypothetical protein [Clostridia bacterium]